MLNFRLLKTVLVCAIATTSAIIVPQVSQAADIRAADAQAASDLPITELPRARSPQFAQLAQFVPINAALLSVTGTGTASTPADKAAILLSYMLNYYPEAPSDPNAPPPLPPTIKEADLKPITDALISAGVAASDISFAPEAYSPQAIRMIIRVNRPTRERLNTLISVANTASTRDNRFLFNTSGIVYTAQNCQAAETTARQAAMANAIEQATALASVANVQIGDILAVTGNTTWRYAAPFSTACPADLDETLRYATLYGTQSYDPSQPAEVSVDSSISLSYEIE